ncbi:MAG: NADH-quinone oxidoreductase subunit M [Anaerolineales bacterium]|jgi:NADH-quinone oxidoreductase subunit M|nr:NADH-quinone oxidoreductase subunit M [Anaerolineales bacterium]
MQFPILSVIVFTPLVASLIIFLMNGERKNEIRVTALAAAVFALVLSIWVYFSYDQAAAGYQFVQKVDWLPILGISYHVGVDGISTPLVLLTGLVMFTGVLISWGIDDRPREFFAFLFLLAGGVFGVFVALDLFMLFFFYEIAVFPMFLLIVIWGWKQTREYAAMKLTLYLFLGSVFALVGALAMYWQVGLNTGIYSFDMLAMEKAGAMAGMVTIFGYSIPFQVFWFLPVFLGFAILGGIFPFHNWSPDGHVAAPTAVSMFHAGVLMKLGAFAALRVGIMLLPEGAIFWQYLILGLALVNVVYGAFIAMIQTDFKYIIGFSSVSHMGLVMLGFATLNREGMVGAGLQMFSHGVMTALFFAAVGMVYDRAHTRQLPELGGMVKALPWVAISFIIGGLVSMGMPGLSGFVAEFPIFMGVWKTQWLVAVIASISIVITAAYILIAIRRVFFGDMPAHFEGHIYPISVLDKVALGTLCLVMFALGMFPGLMAPLVELGVQNVLRLLGGA